MLRVLLIDDNPEDRFLVERELERVFDDIECVHVIDAQQFAHEFDSGRFDLVIADYQFKWSNGLSLLQRLKERYSEKPVVMFTGSGNEEVAVDAMKAGLDDYVIKSPKHYLRLVLAVRTSLEKVEIRRRALRAEAEREELYQREQAARAEAERLLLESQQAERRKDEFLAMLAHELRNPLAPIVNALHLLAEPSLGPAAIGEFRDMIDRQVHHLSRLVDDLLDVSRITRGKVELRRQRLDLAELVRATADDHRRLIEQAGIALHLHIDSESIWVNGDSTRLAQVLGNLLQNATKFNAPGGRITVALSAERKRGSAFVRVEDDGIGIERELLPKVFDIFTQGENGSDRSKGGLGLGLALVKGLVELHGGEVTAASDGPGRGAVFTFWVPLDAAPPADSVPISPADSGRSLKVLIIEDSHDTADSLRMLLELTGHRAEVAYSGSSGIEAARRNPPDVVLCDLGLPAGMDGFEVARALRDDPRTSEARLVAVSGYGQPEDRNHAIVAGFDLHVTKPVMPAELQKLLVGP